MHHAQYKYTRHTHSVNSSCSYEVHEDICIRTNSSLEDVALATCQKIQSNYGLSAYI